MFEVIKYFYLLNFYLNKTLVKLLDSSSKQLETFKLNFHFLNGNAKS